MPKCFLFTQPSELTPVNGLAEEVQGLLMANTCAYVRDHIEPNHTLARINVSPSEEMLTTSIQMTAEVRLLGFISHLSQMLTIPQAAFCINAETTCTDHHDCR